MWKMIEGFDRPVRVSETGEIEELVKSKKHPDGIWKEKKAWYRPRQDDYAVEVHVGGQRKTRNASRIVYEAYRRPLGRGEEITHLDGDKGNRSVENLEAHRKGWSRRRPVEKIDKDGRIIEQYAGIAEAAKENYMTRPGIMYHLSGRARDPFNRCGYTFQFEPEEEEDNVEERNRV